MPNKMPVSILPSSLSIQTEMNNVVQKKQSKTFSKSKGCALFPTPLQNLSAKNVSVD